MKQPDWRQSALMQPSFWRRLSSGRREIFRRRARPIQWRALTEVRLASEIAVFEVIDALQSARAAELRTITLKHNARRAVLDLAELLPETDQ